MKLNETAKTALIFLAVLSSYYLCKDFFSDKSARMKKEINDVREAAYAMNKSQSFQCESVAYSIAYLVSDNNYARDIVEIKGEGFYHCIFAFKDKRTGLFGCGNNNWFGKNGYVEPKYKSIEEMAKDCVKRYINTSRPEIDLNKLRYNVRKNIPEKELKNDLDMLVNLYGSEF